MERFNIGDRATEHAVEAAWSRREYASGRPQFCCPRAVRSRCVKQRGDTGIVPVKPRCLIRTVTYVAPDVIGAQSPGELYDCALVGVRLHSSNR